MSRFFFHLEHAVEVRDERGVELVDVAAAKRHAVKIIAQALCEEPQAFWAADQFRITVTRPDDMVLFTVEMIASLAPALGAAHSGA
jgi:hypothetical protein